MPPLRQAAIPLFVKCKTDSFGKSRKSRQLLYRHKICENGRRYGVERSACRFGCRIACAKESQKGQRPDFNDYLEALSKVDSNMTRPLLGAYESLHKAMGYDGNPIYTIVQASLDAGKLIIEWADKQYAS